MSNVIKNALKAAKEVTTAVVTNKNIMASADLVDQRRSICASCPSLRQVAGLDNCSTCGCFIKAKTILVTEKCPDKKW